MLFMKLVAVVPDLALYKGVVVIRKYFEQAGFPDDLADWIAFCTVNPPGKMIPPPPKVQGVMVKEELFTQIATRWTWINQAEAVRRGMIPAGGVNATPEASM